MNGFLNEYQFIIELNEKRVYQLNPLLRELITDLFDEINDNSFIKSWKNRYKQKTDIFIKIGNQIRSISIKVGSRNSVHTESMDEFVDFLKYHNIPNEIINMYKKYHYGDSTTDGTGNIRLSASECKKIYQTDIDKLNKFFSNEQIITDAVNRFVLYGNNCNHSIDAIVYGTPNDFFWLHAKEILNINIKYKDSYSTAPHFGRLICQPFSRCINRSPKYEYTRNYIQIKWYSLFDDIIENMNNKASNQKI